MHKNSSRSSKLNLPLVARRKQAQFPGYGFYTGLVPEIGIWVLRIYKGNRQIYSRSSASSGVLADILSTWQEGAFHA